MRPTEITGSALGRCISVVGGAFSKTLVAAGGEFDRILFSAGGAFGDRGFEATTQSLFPAGGAFSECVCLVNMCLRQRRVQ